MSRQQLEERLKTLKAEYESGKRQLSELENKQANLKQTLERISAAIQTIEEQLGSKKE
jgi:septal ring factor EnvC (AmiA/AmiB activator)